MAVFSGLEVEKGAKPLIQRSGRTDRKPAERTTEQCSNALERDDPHD
jgi:hypothetical protein